MFLRSVLSKITPLVFTTLRIVEGTVGPALESFDKGVRFYVRPSTACSIIVDALPQTASCDSISSRPEIFGAVVLTIARKGML